MDIITSQKNHPMDIITQKSHPMDIITQKSHPMDIITQKKPSHGYHTTKWFRSFGSPEESGFEPHGKGKQCVDVSSYTFPTWVQQDRKCCKTVTKKHTYQKSAKVCDDVTTLHCDVHPYTECEHKLYEEEVSSSHWTYEHKPAYACVKKEVEIVHKIEKPVCTKKPKRVCNSKW